MNKDKKPCPPYSTGEELAALGFEVIESSETHCLIEGPSEVFAGNCTRQIYEAPESVNLGDDNKTYYFQLYWWRDFGGGQERELAYYETEVQPKIVKLKLIRGGK